jgi:hypothetical protein
MPDFINEAYKYNWYKLRVLSNAFYKNGAAFNLI